MEKTEFKVAGFIFSNAHDYKEAKREEETVEYIRANTDLSNLNKTIKLYHKLVERRTLKTVIGFQFLKELQERILQEGIVSKESIPSIMVEKDEKQIRAYYGELERDHEQKQSEVISNYRIKLRNLRIICAFLTVIIVAMIFISVFSKSNKYVNYENKVIDKYSAWEEELDAREKQLDAREKQLDIRENKLDAGEVSNSLN